MDVVDVDFEALDVGDDVNDVDFDVVNVNFDTIYVADDVRDVDFEALDVVDDVKNVVNVCFYSDYPLFHIKTDLWFINFYIWNHNNKIIIMIQC